MTCKKCSAKFSSTVRIEGKKHRLGNRLFCLSCSPFNNHNTKDLTKTPASRRRPGAYKYVKEYRARVKQKCLAYKGGSCQRCGYNRSPRALTFHHLDPSKKDFGVAAAHRPWSVVKQELDKCILLCFNCHMEEHERLDLARTSTAEAPADNRVMQVQLLPGQPA